ncbi:hypothetical protein F2Q69_00056473 [Brassica cretica]|uniref:Uncharacterized protein n=1 Tax=Brassica cretica TaxID=69181 RepID=A0A8S9N1R6_BRACR|nr:hypothetical protein F2Q69_00056473 [Brassica cretica]
MWTKGVGGGHSQTILTSNIAMLRVMGGSSHTLIHISRGLCVLVGSQHSAFRLAGGSLSGGTLCEQEFVCGFITRVGFGGASSARSEIGDVTVRSPASDWGYRKIVMDTCLLLRVPLMVPRVEGHITLCEILSHPYPYTSTYSPAHRKMEREGMSNGLLSEVTLDQHVCMTLYTTPCRNQG